MQSRAISTDEIYESLTDDGVFAALPARLAEAFGGRSSLIHWRHGDGSADIMGESGYFSPEHLARFATEFAPFDPWAIASVKVQPLNWAMNLEELVPQREYERSFFYNEFIRSIGDDTIRGMGVRVDNDWGAGLLAIQRGRRQDSFSDAEVKSFGEVCTHLRRILAVRGRFGSLGKAATSLQSMLDGLGYAAMLVRGDGGLIRLNAAGEEMIKAGSILRLKQGRLETSNADCAMALRKAMAAACSPAPSAGVVMLARCDGRPRLATIVPVHAAGTGRQALVLLASGGGAETPLAALRDLFALTRAEGEIAVALTDGSSPATIAERRGVAFSTVRAQLKAIAQKMDCRRQSEIVSIVTAMVPTRPVH